MFAIYRQTTQFTRLVDAMNSAAEAGNEFFEVAGEFFTGTLIAEERTLSNAMLVRDTEAAEGVIVDEANDIQY